MVLDRKASGGPGRTHWWTLVGGSLLANLVGTAEVSEGN